MKNNILALFLLSIVLSIKPVMANTVVSPVLDNNAVMISQKMHTFMQQHHISGAAVEVYIHGVPYSYYYGYANQARKIPVMPETIFEVGSFTKVFTSLLIAEEVDAGRLKLNDTITKYLPDFSSAAKDNLENMTIQELATHTTGFAHDVPEAINTRFALIHYFSEWKPAATIGSQWIYSNVGIGLLGYILEGLTHRSYNQLYRDDILKPLGMEPIGLTVPKRLKSHDATGYGDDEEVVPPFKDSLFPASGAMKASGQDMLKFLKAAIGLPGTPLIISKAMRLTQTPYVETPALKQGLAWEIYAINSQNIAALLNLPAAVELGPLPARQLTVAEQKFDGDALIEKTGATAGFRAYMAVIPNRQSGIVILTNHRSINNDIVKLGRSILLSCAQ